MGGARPRRSQGRAMSVNDRFHGWLDSTLGPVRSVRTPRSPNLRSSAVSRRRDARRRRPGAFAVKPRTRRFGWIAGLRCSASPPRWCSTSSQPGVLFTPSQVAASQAPRSRRLSHRQMVRRRAVRTRHPDRPLPVTIPRARCQSPRGPPPDLFKEGKGVSCGDRWRPTAASTLPSARQARCPLRTARAWGQSTKPDRE
jgi:hypothetical protein